LSKHRHFNNTDMFWSASELLECASFRLPHLKTQFNDIRHCLEHVDIYDVRNGRVPYLRSSIPQAFVLTFDDKSVFVSSEFTSMSLVNRALVMIHECAHIGIGAIDHAYIWEERYQKLTYKQHMSNADSFMHLVLTYCT
jgi:predicted metallopeptidase